MISILGAASLSVVFAEDGNHKVGSESKAIRTIMIYLDGAASETNNPVCSAMIKEYISAKFNREDIRIIVMTGGSNKWHLDSKYLRDWDGVSGDGADAKRSEDELMSDPDTLKGFINSAKNFAPAEKY